MYLTEYQKISVDNFMGLWDRGSLDDVPPDHATDTRNIAFARKREVVTRPATNFSHVLPSGGNVIRQFDAAFNNNTLIPLACDGIGNIWRLDNYTVLLNLPNLVDFCALNMGNHVYIAPIFADIGIPGQPGYQKWNFDPMLDVIYVWADPSFPIRPAAGFKPPPIGSVLPVGGGNIGPGWYGFAISYVYNTGYVTPPSDVVTVNMPGGTSVELRNIYPVAQALPPGVIGFLIFSTKAQSTQIDATRAALYELVTSFDLSSGGHTLIEDFFDTDLVILATADPTNGNLLNSMPRLPSGGGYGSVSLIKYHGRMIIIGPFISYNPDYGDAGEPLFSQLVDGRIFISHPGAPENFDDLTGYLIVQAEFDGNYPRTGFELFGVLYICKPVGTFSTQDNGAEPNDAVNPWTVNMIDGGIGAYHHGVGTITGSQPSLSFNSTAFLANRNGLFIFNGNVLRPELSWKIRHVWEQMTHNVESEIRVTVDIYNDLFYVMIPTDDPRFNPHPGVIPNGSFSLTPKIVLLGDYSLGLDSNNIRWSVYTFPYPVYDITMAAWPDPTTQDGRGLDFYYLRLGTPGIIYKVDGFTLDDQVWINEGGVGQFGQFVPIDNWYQSAPLVTGDLGSLNICRFVRYRMAGQGVLYSTLQDQGTYVPTVPRSQLIQMVNVSPNLYPGNYKDVGIQTNFTNEKVVVKFRMNNSNNFLRMARFDVFGKARWPTRPNA